MAPATAHSVSAASGSGSDAGTTTGAGDGTASAAPSGTAASGSGSDAGTTTVHHEFLAAHSQVDDDQAHIAVRNYSALGPWSASSSQHVAGFDDSNVRTDSASSQSVVHDKFSIHGSVANVVYYASPNIEYGPAGPGVSSTMRGSLLEHLHSFSSATSASSTLLDYHYEQLRSAIIAPGTDHQGVFPSANGDLQHITYNHHHVLSADHLAELPDVTTHHGF